MLSSDSLKQLLGMNICVSAGGFQVGVYAIGRFIAF